MYSVQFKCFIVLQNLKLQKGKIFENNSNLCFLISDVNESNVIMKYVFYDTIIFRLLVMFFIDL